jgi:hypothetical protein
MMLMLIVTSFSVVPVSSPALTALCPDSVPSTPKTIMSLSFPADFSVSITPSAISSFAHAMIFICGELVRYASVISCAVEADHEPSSSPIRLNLGLLPTTLSIPFIRRRILSLVPPFMYSILSVTAGLSLK